MFNQFYAGKKIFITGHTGFKGAWLTQWLVELGAKVTGYSLPLEDDNRLFTQLGLGQSVQSIFGNITDQLCLKNALLQTQPDIIFHLAAQPLVRYSYAEPVATYAANVMGTVHVLDALRSLKKPCAALFITTDKTYENQEWLHAYRETDRLGGHDPYSSSKACAELAVASFRQSFHAHSNNTIHIATARAGNVIGGGDWAVDRIIPDCVRALHNNTSISVRNKIATRPWQHVLEPLSGYLQLAARIHPDSMQQLPGNTRALMLNAFNFGPTLDSNRTVKDVVESLLQHWPGQWEDCSDPNAVHEAGRLNLSIDKAHHLLSWQPIWDFDETIKRTIQWYQDCADHFEANEFAPVVRARTMEDIKAYTKEARRRKILWTVELNSINPCH